MPIGNINFQSTPSGAEVYLDGTRITGDNGQMLTPFLASAWLVGTYNLTMKKSGYQDYVNTITVVSGQTVNVAPTLISAILPDTPLSETEIWNIISIEKYQAIFRNHYRRNTGADISNARWFANNGVNTINLLDSWYCTVARSDNFPNEICELLTIPSPPPPPSCTDPSSTMSIS